MSNWKIKLSLFLNYFVFAILLNSVGTVILQVQSNFAITEGSASILEAFKDLSIAATSFLLASYITRIGYKRAMMLALVLVILGCLMMPSLPGFAMTKVLFAMTGIGFGLIKMSVFATIGLVTSDKKEHASFMNFIESFFTIGVFAGYFIFSAFVDNAHPESTSWLKVYYLLAGIAAAALLMLWMAPLDESAVHQGEQKSLIAEFADMFKLAIKPLVLIFVMSAFIYVLIEQSTMTWLPTFFKKAVNLPQSLAIEMTSILAISMALGRFAAGFLFRYIHWYRALLICIVGAGAVLLITIPMTQQNAGAVVTGWGDAPFAAFLLPLIGLFIAPIYPAINSVMLSSLPVRQHAVMSGLIVIFSALGGTTGSMITGHFFEAYGGVTAFYLLLIPIAGLIVCLTIFNRIQQKEQIAAA